MSADISGGSFRNHERTPKTGRNPPEAVPFPVSDSPEGYSFLGWTLDLRRQTLMKAGEERHLRVKAYDVLVYLVRHPGRVVGKQELLDAVWSDVAVTEDSLVQCLIEIRRALGDEQQAIKTVRGRGYLLDARVEPRRLTPATVSTFPASPVVPIVAPVATVAAESTGPLRAVRDTGVADALAARPLWWTIAAIVVVLAIVGGLTSWWARPRLGTGGARVTAQQTLNPEARQAFEEGTALVNRLSQSDMQRARQLFTRAATLDPGFAAAHAELAFQLEVLAAFGVERPSDVLPQAMSEARRAVELDPTLARAWLALGHAFVLGEWDWQQGEAAYRRAIALDPQDPFPHFLLAHLLMGVGRSSEALTLSLRARALRPREARFASSNGLLLHWSRQYEASRRAFMDAVALDGGLSLPRFWMALNEVALGDLDAAMTAALAARQAMGNAPTWIVGYVHAIAGRRAEALEVLRALEAHRARTYVSATELAFLHIGLGNHDAALEWLETGFRERSRWIELLAVLPLADPLREQPRFKQLLRALNLPEK